MKNITRSFLFMAVLFVPAAVFAQGSGSVEPNSPRPLNDGLRDDNNFVVTRSLSGTVVGINEGVLTIKTDKGKEIRIGLVNRTKFRIGKKTIKSDELDAKLFTAGNQVKITYLPFEGKDSGFDRVAVEVRFAEDKSKDKPVLG